MPPSTWRNHHQTITNTFMDYCNNVDYHSHQIVGHRTKLHHQILAAQMLHHPHHDLVLHHVAHCILHRDIDVGHWHNAWCTNFMVKWVSAVATLGNSSILKRDRIIHGSLSIWLNILFLIIQTSRSSIKCGGIPALTNMNLGLRLTGGFNIALQIPSGRDQSGLCTYQKVTDFVQCHLESLFCHSWCIFSMSTKPQAFYFEKILTSRNWMRCKKDFHIVISRVKGYLFLGIFIVALSERSEINELVKSG